MRLKLHTLLINKNSLKINSLFLGFAVWALFTSSRHATRIVTVPVGFYNACAQHTITAPPTVTVTLSGPRTALRTIAPGTLMLHVDAQPLTPGMNCVAISAQNLLLPPEINLVNCKHINCILTPPSVISQGS